MNNVISKKPPIQLTVDKVLFNELISILDFNIDLEQVKDNLSENARK